VQLSFSLGHIPRRAHNLGAVRSKRPRSFHTNPRRNPRDEDPFAVQIHTGQNLIVVKTADGTQHTIKVTDAATLKGTKDGDGFNGLKEGTQIVARTTGKGADETAMEIGKISNDGFKATHGTVEKFDKDTKTIVVKNVHEAKKTFELSGKALEDAGKATDAGIAKGTIVMVYLHGRGRGESGLLCFKLTDLNRPRAQSI
jgi:hypothetical protein